jgi:hypothetical protein
MSEGVSRIVRNRPLLALQFPCLIFPKFLQGELAWLLRLHASTAISIAEHSSSLQRLHSLLPVYPVR